MTNKHNNCEAQPVAYVMKHVTGMDIGLAWRADDPQFDQSWKRIPLAYWDGRAQQAVDSERDRALHAAKVLVDKLEVIHQCPEYNAVWVLSANRGMPYKGPNYFDELESLKSALKSQQRAKAGAE